MRIFTFFNVRFWDKAPSLWCALALFLGLMLTKTTFVLIPASIVLLLLNFKQRALFILLFGMAFFLTKNVYLFPEKRCEGQGVFAIHSMKHIERRGWYYKGSLKTFTNNDGIVAKRIPATLFSKEKYDPHFFYEIHGELIPQGGRFLLKTKEKLKPTQERKTFAMVRYKAKKEVKKYVRKAFKKADLTHFFYALITGEKEDRVLPFIFAKMGLAHLLAISGFHFALLSQCLYLFMRPLPEKVRIPLLCASLSLFFLFVGFLGSVERAFVMALFFLLGLMLEKRSYSINNLGLALLAICATSPLLMLELGTQMSFLATAAIIVIFPLCDQLLKKLFPTPNLQDVSNLVRIGYKLNGLCRKAVALDIAVHLALVPLLLYHFHSFAVHGLIYNLFFPPMVAVSIFFFLFTIPINFLIPVFGRGLFWINERYTTWVLNLIEDAPLGMKTVYVESFPAWFCWIYIPLLFLGAALLNQYLKEKREEFMFL